jgi:hypothetical protein
MTTPTGKEKSSAVVPDITTAKQDIKSKYKPNRNSIAMRPHKHVDMTKAEMYEDLRKAVENTR